MAMSLDPLGGGGRKRGGPRFRARAEINVTPFVDVMLVLLIVFMVTAPLLTVGELVTLPETSSSNLPADDKPLAITVLSDGSVLVQETPVEFEQLGALVAAVAEAGGRTAEDRIYIYGDDAADYGDVVKVMAEVRSAGFPNLALVTDRASDASAPDAAEPE